MDSIQYLNELLSFYSRIGQFPVVHLVTVDNGEHVQVRVNRKTELVLPYNLGFCIGLSSWITNKLIQKNIKLLESILVTANKDLLVTVDIKRGKCIIKIINRFGKLVKKYKLKYLSFNLFPFDFK
jgi:hypothetical protein